MVRYALLVSSASLIFAVTGCGGSGGGSGGTGGGPTPPTVSTPTLTAIAPSTAQAGGPAITMLVYGSNFLDGVAVQWNGTALATNCVESTNISVFVDCTSANALTASIPASDLAAVGNAKVAISNPAGDKSGSITFTIAAAPAMTTWVRAVAGITSPQDIVWDGTHGKLYASIGSTDAVAPNTIVAIDPIAGTAGTPVSAVSNPNQLSISSDASYLWVGLDGSNIVQRFLLPSLTKDISFPLPLDPQGDPQWAVSLQAAPASPHAVAVIAGRYGNGDGVYIYDDATQRHNYVPGFGPPGGPLIDWIQWGGNNSTIYGNNHTTIDEGGSQLSASIPLECRWSTTTVDS